MNIDFLIIGAGLTGCTLAERLATQLGKKVLIVDRRNHIGGNCHDYYNTDGVLVHKYGPHYFRTNSKSVWDYLGNFTEWHYVQYKILAFVDGQYLNLPINLNTVNQLYGSSMSSKELQSYFDGLKELCPDEIMDSRDQIVSQVGTELYEKFFRNYTKKQWDLFPEELDSSVCARIPVRTSRDDRYFSDRYQAMPKHGYHRMFEKMVEHPNIQIMLQTDYRDVMSLFPEARVIYTGAIDEFFEYRYGRLPYRSLLFEHETVDREFYQQVSQVNYPNDYDFTRIVEIKHVTGQVHPKTTIVREYPESSGDPFYPVPAPENRLLYEKYHYDAEQLSKIIFIGRLAEYRYLNMDQVVEKAFATFEDIFTKAV